MRVGVHNSPLYSSKVFFLGRVTCLRRPQTALIARSLIPLTKWQPRKSCLVQAIAGAEPVTGFDYKTNQTAEMSDSDAGPEWSHHSNFPLRQQMLDCTSARELQTLLQQNGPELESADVAAAWHVAAQQRLLTLARSGDSGQAALLKHLLFLTDKHIDGMDPAAISTTAWAISASESGSSELMEKLLDAAERHMINFLPCQLCTLLWATASHPRLVDHRRHAPFITLASFVQQGMRLELFLPKEVSTLLWAMGKVAYGHEAILAEAELECCRQMPFFTAADTARAMHGFAMLRHNPITLRGPLSKRWGNASTMDTFSPENAALLMVAHGKLGVEPDKPLLGAMVRRLGALVPPSKLIINKFPKGRRPKDGSMEPERIEIDPSNFLHPRHLAHSIWALARLDYRPTEGAFISKLLRHLEANPGLYEAEDLSAIFWACSHLQVEIPQSLVIIAAERATVLAPKESPALVSSMLRHIAAVTTAVNGKVPAAARRFSVIAAAVVIPQIAKLEPEEVASTIIALGTLEMPPLQRPSAVMLQRACLAAIPEVSSELLPQLAWAMVRLRWSTPVLVDALLSAAAFRAALMTPEGLAQLTWAFAAMERPHNQLAAALVTQCCAKLGNFCTRDKARLAWALAHLSQKHPVINQRVLSVVITGITKQEVVKLDPTSVAAIVWACGKLERHPGQVLDAAAKQINLNTRFYSKEQLMQVRAVLEKHGSTKKGFAPK